MDFHRNVSFSGGLPAPQPIHDTLKPEYPPVSVQTSTVPGGCSGSLDEFLFTDKTDGDIGLEWLSVFVEDCFSFTGNCLPGENQATATQLQKTVSTEPTSTKPAGNLQKPNLELVVPGKARTKRRRSSSTWSYDHEEPLHENSFDIDPPLLQQAYWLADSELLIQKPKEDQKTELLDEEEEQQEEEGEDEEEEKTSKDGNNSGGSDGSNGQPRRCSHCLAQKTPQWRAGPLGPKTLCNACGVRFKSGRLLPEYRPAKSPTFVSFKHSNSHKKVMEMRMSTIVSE